MTTQRRAFAAATAALAVVLAAAPAAAQPAAEPPLYAPTPAPPSGPPASGPPPSAPGPGRYGWYGWRVAIADVAGAGLFRLGLYVADENADCECEEFGSGYLMMVGASGYVGGGPFLHGLRRRYPALAGSVVLRVGLPLVAGLAADDAGWSRSDIGWAIAGGAATAALLDWTLLSHERPRAPRDVPAVPQLERQRAVSPFLARTRRGAAFGLTGHF